MCEWQQFYMSNTDVDISCKSGSLLYAKTTHRRKQFIVAEMGRGNGWPLVVFRCPSDKTGRVKG